MKILILFASIVMLFGCNKEKSKTNNIIGNWKMTESFDDYNNSNGFSWKYPTEITTTNIGDNSFVLNKNNEVLFNGFYKLNQETNEIIITQNQKTILYTLTIIQQSNNNITVAYKTTNGTYIHKFCRIN